MPDGDYPKARSSLNELFHCMIGAGWQWSYLSEDMPIEPNLTLGGLPSARNYTPGSQQAYAAQNIFVSTNAKLIKIAMIDVDGMEHREFYVNILTTFRINE
ncbi:MAG: hypothetical protein E4G99_06180 [Anaerolineales bacterium]|nr:MAG: hypothetical protein E4G99_06180 [Anaerolineales bacterium]